MSLSAFILSQKQHQPYYETFFLKGQLRLLFIMIIISFIRECITLYHSWSPLLSTPGTASLTVVSQCIFIYAYARHVRPPSLCGFPRFLFPNFAFFSCDSARIIELSSAQLDRAEIANFVPVSWAMLLNSKEFRSEAQLKYTVLRKALPGGV